MNVVMEQNYKIETISKNMRKLFEKAQTSEGIWDLKSHPAGHLLSELDHRQHLLHSSAALLDFTILNQLDHLSLTASTFDLNICPFDIIDAIETVMHIQKPQAIHHGIDFYIVADNVEVNQKGLIAQTQKRNEMILKKSNIQVRQVWDQQRPINSYMINCDRQRVMQVLLALLQNTLKYTKKGSV